MSAFRGLLSHRREYAVVDGGWTESTGSRSDATENGDYSTGCRTAEVDSYGARNGGNSTARSNDVCAFALRKCFGDGKTR